MRSVVFFVGRAIMWTALVAAVVLGLLAARSARHARRHLAPGVAAWRAHLHPGAEEPALYAPAGQLHAARAARLGRCAFACAAAAGILAAVLR